MKSGCLFAVMVFLYFSVSAQLQSGAVMLGSDISHFDVSLNEGGNFEMGLNPKVGWFVRNNMALGAFVDFTLATAKNMGTATNYGVGLFGRYYISDATINLLQQSRFFAEASAGIMGYNPYSGSNTNGLGIGFGPGIAYFISRNVALESLLKYNGIFGFGSSVTSSKLNLSFGLQVYIVGRYKKAANEVL